MFYYEALFMVLNAWGSFEDDMQQTNEALELQMDLHFEGARIVGSKVEFALEGDECGF